MTQPTNSSSLTTHAAAAMQAEASLKRSREEETTETNQKKYRNAPQQVSTEQNSALLALPSELLLNVLGNLDLQDVQACSLVCRQLKALTDVSSLWRILFARDFQGSEALPNPDDCLAAYKARHHLRSNLTKAVFASHTLRGHAFMITSIIVADGLLISGSADNTIKVWDDKTGVCVRTLEGHTEAVSSLVLVDGLLISGSADSTIKIWNYKTGVCVRTLEGHTSGILSLIFADGLLISSSADNSIKIWDYTTGVCVRTLEGHTHSVSSINFADGRLISSSIDPDPADRTLKIWDIKTGECKLTHLEGHAFQFSPLHLLADGKYILGTADGTIRIWDLQTGATLNLAGHTNKISSLVIADGKLISGAWDNSIRIWDLQTGACLKHLTEHTHMIDSLIVADGLLFSSSADRKIKIWDYRTGECKRTVDTSNASFSFIVAEGKLITFSGCTIKIWDYKTGECFHTLEGYSGLNYPRALTDWKLISDSPDSTIRIVDFKATDNAIFTEIANLLRSENPAVVQEAMERFSRMPKKARELVYQELSDILKPFRGNAEHAFHDKEGQSSTPKQKAHAIEKFLAKQGITTAADPGENLSNTN